MRINLRNLNKEAKNINLDKVDVSSLWESLLLCGPAVKQFCKQIDADMKTITTFNYSACLKPMEQYDRIIENVNHKSQLMVIYNVFVDWYVKLSDKEKKCCRDYVINRYKKMDGRIAGRPGNATLRGDESRTVWKLISSFKDRIKTAFDLDEKELIRNPYIYRLYVKIVYRKEYNRKNKGEFTHDNSTNERCYC